MTPQAVPEERQPLTRERVIAAALRLLDRGGPGALTMRALGRELTADPMAVYHYFPHKEALLDGVVEAVWSELRLPPVTGEPWQIQLKRIAVAVRDTLRRHPHALPLVASRPGTSAPGFRLADRTLGVLRLAGIPHREALEFANASGEFLLGHALSEAGAGALASWGAGDAANGGTEDVEAAFAHASAVEDFPHLAEALRAGVSLRKMEMDRIFAAGVGAMRRGIEKRLEELAAVAG